MSRKRSTNEQITFFINYMSNHTDFANGEYTGPLGARRHQEEWARLAELLREKGPDKTVEQWKQTWRDLKRRARSDNAAYVRIQFRNGKAAPVQNISETNEKVLCTIGTESSAGIGPPEAPLPQDMAESQRRKARKSSNLKISRDLYLERNDNEESYEKTPKNEKEENGLMEPPFIECLNSDETLLEDNYSTMQRDALSMSDASFEPEFQRKRKRKSNAVLSMSQILRLEEKRLNLEHKKEAHFHERELQREKYLHEREMERLKIESKRLESTTKQNELLESLINIARIMAEKYS